MKNKDYSINQHLIDCFVFYLITSDSFIQKVRPVVEPRHFKRSKVVQDIIKVCYEFYDTAGKAPKDHMNDEVVDFLKGREKDQIEFYVKYLEKLQEVETQHIDQNYVLIRLNNFVRRYELEKAAESFVNLIQEGEYDEAVQNITKACRTGIQEVELGYIWSDPNQTPPYLLEENRDKRLIGLGLPVLDRKIPRGICRKDLVCVAGPYKGMKSFYLHLLGIEGMMEGLNVLHITHENSKEDTWARYDSIISGLDSVEGTKEFDFVERDENGNVIDSFSINIQSIHEDTGKVVESKQTLLRYGGQLRIQEYPMGRCSMGEINRFLSRLEFENFYPDIVINDYIEKMYVEDSKKSRPVAIDDMYKESKAIATERRLAMITASQVTSDHLDRSIKSQSAAAEARSKVGDVDLMLALSATKDQREAGISMAYVLANRHGPMFCGCYFDSVLGAGEVVLNCWPIPNRNPDQQ